jgi:hypothetical protein
MARPRNQRERLARKAQLDERNRQAKAQSFTPKAIREVDPPTPEEIRGMKKADLVEAAERMNIDSSGKVDELRARMLAAVEAHG